MNQSTLRADDYIHLRDALAIGGRTEDLGQLVILPATFTGSPRHMHEYTQDAMTYVRKYGTPDLFITFTCNPKWKEIINELLPGQTHVDRHDLIARVFVLKLKKLMNLITKGQAFGTTKCWMYSIEWQKRGLPHAHILVWLSTKITPNQIDNIICAEIPNKQLDPILFDVIVKNMIHGPCGSLNKNSPCMNANGKCSKNFPKPFLQETQNGSDGYPLYRRRQPDDGGFTADLTLKINNKRIPIQVDNRWVVPYNKLLSKIFKAHINVEYCNSIKSIHYVCKYVNKGSDQAVFELNEAGNYDETQRFLEGRYISSNEAIWRILDFQIHERYPFVQHLSVHLQNGQRIFFNPQNVQQQISNPPNTTLTAFFNLCQHDDFAKTLLYCEVPAFYTWNVSTKIFKRRIQGVPVENFPGVKSSDALGRVYTVHPSNAECFFLRILLHHVRGPTSFDYLKTVDGNVCETFRQACQLLELLENDQHWNNTLDEAAVTSSSSKLQNLFAIIISTCSPSNPMQLWDSFKDYLIADYLHEQRMANPDLTIEPTEEMFNKILIIIEDKVLDISGKTLDKFGLQQPDRTRNNEMTREEFRERNYNFSELGEFIVENQHLLNADQKVVIDTVMEHVERNSSGIFFLDAPGGTGKTFVINLLLAKIRKDKKIVLAVASSGIAATLLQGGRTAHSTFKLPLDLIRNDNAMCNICKGTGTARLLNQCSLIIWDECTMAHKNALEALNRTLMDIRNSKDLMGGVVLLLSGDFRQTLPIIPRGTRADIIKACLKSSSLWKHVKM